MKLKSQHSKCEYLFNSIQEYKKEEIIEILFFAFNIEIFTFILMIEF